MIWNIVAIGLIGALVGSFLTTLVERLPRGESFLRGRSRCPHCGHLLRTAELVPIVSFLILRGRCRRCGAPIPRWHLAVELSAVALFVAAAVLHPTRSVADFAFLLALLAILLALTVIDLQHLLLPDILVGALAAIGILRVVLQGSAATIGGSVLAFCAGIVLLRLLAGYPWPQVRHSFSAGGQSSFSSARLPASVGGPSMGLGDVKLAGAMGLTLGLSGLLTALFLSFIIGGVVGVLLLATRRARMGSRIPFGPFLCGATALVLLFPRLPADLSRFLGLSYT